MSGSDDRVDPSEDRVDLESRTRVVALERRYRRATKLMLAGLAVTAAATTLALVGVTSAIDAQHTSRLKAIREVCRAQNATNGGIVTFVHHVAPKLGREVAADFPIVADCDAYARRLSK